MTWITWKGAGKFKYESHLPPGAGRNTVAELLPAAIKGFANWSRKFHSSIEELPFTYAERQMQSALLPAFDGVADVAFLEQPLERKKPIGEGLKPGGYGWVDYYLEHRGLVVLVEVKHAWMACRTGKVITWTRDEWKKCREQLEQIRKTGAKSILDPGTPYYAVGLMVVVHHAGGNDEVDPPQLDDLWKRHRKLVRKLDAINATSDWPITWHGVWRLHESLCVEWEGDEEPWLHYPAVSFAAMASPQTA